MSPHRSSHTDILDAELPHPASFLSLSQLQTRNSAGEVPQSWSSRTDALGAALSFPSSQVAIAEVADKEAGERQTGKLSFSWLLQGVVVSDSESHCSR